MFLRSSRVACRNFQRASNALSAGKKLLNTTAFRFSEDAPKSTANTSENPFGFVPSYETLSSKYRGKYSREEFDKFFSQISQHFTPETLQALSKGKQDLTPEENELLFKQAQNMPEGVRDMIEEFSSVHDLWMSNPTKYPKVSDADFVNMENQKEELEDLAQLKAEGLIRETEVAKGDKQSHTFQAETRQLLDIVAKSLYTDKEVFVRELISNASDALEKLRHMQVQNVDFIEKDLPFEIGLSVDEDERTFTIQDTGIGMSKDELIENLGTIAKSGSKNFMRQLQEQGNTGDAVNNIIGQFGVGFYSIFMVAENVKVYSKSATGSVGYLWESNGGGSYTIAEADNVQRGTKIIAKIKPQEREFTVTEFVSRVIKRYSNFVGFPIKLNGTIINTVEAVWLKSPSSVTEEQYKGLYSLVGHSSDAYLYKLHYTTDVPLSLHSVFFTPSKHQEKYGMGRMEPGVHLYSRKVLIQHKAKNLLPEWLRFMKGIVDSEEIPLNLSREHLQDSALVRRINGILTRRITKWFDEEAKANPEKYATEFYPEYCNFLKEGICTDITHKNDLGKLLRYDSSKLAEGDHPISLEEYISRAGKDQKKIYYLCAPSRAFAESSPYFEIFKKKGIEVLFMYSPADEFVVHNLPEFKGMKFASIESRDLDVKDEKTEEEKNEDESQNLKLNSEQSQELSTFFMKTLSSKVEWAKSTDRLSNSPAIVVDHESGTIRRAMRMVESSKSPVLPPQKLEFNPSHPIIRKLYYLTKSNANPELAETIAEQVFDNALVAAGLLDDSRSMLNRLNQIMEFTLNNVQESPKTQE